MSQNISTNILMHRVKWKNKNIELSCCSFTPYQVNATPLWWASRKGHHDVVQSLLTAGRADVNIAIMPEVTDEHIQEIHVCKLLFFLSIGSESFVDSKSQWTP